MYSYYDMILTKCNPILRITHFTQSQREHTEMRSDVEEPCIENVNATASKPEILRERGFRPSWWKARA